jgi:hypothetical protein
VFEDDAHIKRFLTMRDEYSNMKMDFYEEEYFG